MAGDVINVYVGGGGPPDPRLDTILTLLQELKTMSADATKAILARIDAATSAIGERITALIAKIGTGMTDAEVAEVNAALSAEADTLEAMGKSDPTVISAKLDA